MTRCFLDTSVLVKLYHQEDGTDYLLNLYKGQSPLIISQLSMVELRSAIFRKLRERELDKITLGAVLSRFDQDCEDRYDILPVVSVVYEQAGKLLGKCAGNHGLRALDSIQLATFIVYCDKEHDSLICADRILAGVAENEGIDLVFI